MSMLDDATKIATDEIDNAKKEEHEKAVWEEANADKRDLIALDLTSVESALLDEFISNVPEVCWNSQLCSYTYFAGTRDVDCIFVDEDRVRYPQKYLAPDNSVRLCIRIDYSSRFYCPPVLVSTVGSQKSIAFGEVILFDDKTVFYVKEEQKKLFLFSQGFCFRPSDAGILREHLSDRNFYINWLKELLKDSQAIIANIANLKEAEKEEQRVRSQRWDRLGLCKFCGGKLGIVSRKCKSCGK